MSDAPINQRIRLVAEDLSMLNGLSERINTAYLKNLQQIILYNVAEKIRNGAEEINVDVPFLGTINIKRHLRSTTKKDSEPSYSYTYGFKPSNSFSREIRRIYDDGTSKLPDMFADKYGNKLLSMYEHFLND